MRSRRFVLGIGLAALAVCWALAVVVALNDIDFFSLEDLLDTTKLHHEHIVVGLIILGIVALALAIAAARRRPRGPAKSEV